MGKVLIACEESQAVCIEFRKLGIEAYSCDIQDCSGGHPEWHIKGDVLEVINRGWDMMIGFPPCTYITYAGTAHWNNPGRVFKRLEGLQFFAKLWEANIPRICLENPKGCASPTIAKYSQEIQPYYFGDNHVKTTWLWLRGLPKLEYKEKNDLFSTATSIGKPKPIYVTAGNKNIYFVDSLISVRDREERAKQRSKTFPGIAMAEQWSKFV